MSHKTGGIAVGDIIQALILQVVRQIDQAVVAVNIAFLICDTDPEHSVFFIQDAQGLGSRSLAQNLRFFRILVKIQFLNGPNRTVHRRISGGHCDLL